jgi:hypothetical protein
VVCVGWRQDKVSSVLPHHSKKHSIHNAFCVLIVSELSLESLLGERKFHNVVRVVRKIDILFPIFFFLRFFYFNKMNE